MRLVLLVLLLPAFVLTGCTAGEPSTYKAGPTAKCLSGKGYTVTTDDAKVGVVAANAPNGGLRANEPGTPSRSPSARTPTTPSRSPPHSSGSPPKKLKPHITDVMRTQKNAVLLWTVTPPQDELNKVFACLKG